MDFEPEEQVMLRDTTRGDAQDLTSGPIPQNSPAANSAGTGTWNSLAEISILRLLSISPGGRQRQRRTRRGGHRADRAGPRALLLSRTWIPVVVPGALDLSGLPTTNCWARSPSGETLGAFAHH